MAPHMRKNGAVLVVLLLLCASPASAEKFLSVSDIHFDPFADPSLVAQLEAGDVSKWGAILATSSQKSFSTYGSDINDALLRSAVAEMNAGSSDMSLNCQNSVPPLEPALVMFLN